MYIKFVYIYCLLYLLPSIVNAQIEVDSLDEEIELNIEVNSPDKGQVSSDKSQVAPCFSSN